MPTSKLKKFRKQSVLRMNEVNEARRRQKKGNTLMLNKYLHMYLQLNI